MTLPLIAHYAAVRRRLMSIDDHVAMEKPPRYREYVGSVAGAVRSRQINTAEVIRFHNYQTRHTRPANKPHQIGALAEPHLTYGPPRRPVRLRAILTAVCRHFAIDPLDLLSQRRTAKIVYPRQIAFYLARILTTKSFPEIGRQYGGKDHTSVMHACRKIERLIPTRPGLVADIAECRQAAIEFDPALDPARVMEGVE